MVAKMPENRKLILARTEVRGRHAAYIITAHAEHMLDSVMPLFQLKI